MTMMKVSLNQLNVLRRALLRNGLSTTHYSCSNLLRGHRAMSSARPLPEDEIYEFPKVSSTAKSKFTHHRSKETITTPQELMLSYTKDVNIPITSTLHIVTPNEDTPSGIWPAYRLMVSDKNQLANRAKCNSGKPYFCF